MVKIYADYGDEPEDEFIPIPDHLADTYYDLEMDSYTEDALFYSNVLADNSTILELGCGSGRVGRCLAQKGHNVIGVDISLSMLQKAKLRMHPSLFFLAMDMTALAFNCTFDSIIIPYNSLNLLVTKENILNCLQGCRPLVKKDGLLIAQIFIPTQKFLTEKKKSFQFQIFDLQPSGRLIKEIKKQYHPDSKTISIEERFRVRPTGPRALSTDYNNTYTIAAYEISDWLRVFEECGFTIRNCYEDFAKTPINSTDSANLLIVCE